MSVVTRSTPPWRPTMRSNVPSFAASSFLSLSVTAVLLAVMLGGHVCAGEPTKMAAAAAARRSDAAGSSPIQPEVAAALLTMAKQDSARQQIKKYKKLLAEANGSANPFPPAPLRPVSVASHGVAGSRGGAQEKSHDDDDDDDVGGVGLHQSSLSANVAKLLKLPQKLLGIVNAGAEEHKHQKQLARHQKELLLHKAAVAARTSRSKKSKKAGKKVEASRKAASSPLLLAKVTGTTAGGYSSPGQDTQTSASSPVKKTSTTGYDNDPYSGLDVGSLSGILGVGGQSASAAGGGGVGAGEYADDSAGGGGGGGGGGSSAAGGGVGLLGGGGYTSKAASAGGALSDSHGASHGGYIEDPSAYGSYDTSYGGAGGGILPGLAGELVRDSATFLKGLGFLLPIGLFLAALPPNVINVAVTGTAGAAVANSVLQGRRRKRSAGSGAGSDEDDAEDFSYNLTPEDLEKEYYGGLVPKHNSGKYFGWNKRSDSSEESSLPVVESPVAAVLDFMASSNVLGDSAFSREELSASGGNGLETWPVMDMIDDYGITAVLTEANCQKRIFCELVQLGRDHDGNAVQRSLWNTVRSMPESLIGTYVDGKLFNIVKDGDCEQFVCAKRIQLDKPSTA